MPYSSEHKAETRERIVNCARRLFNRRGFTEVSIDEIMAGAGLTRGGFYNHFATKDELYAEAITLSTKCEKTDAQGKTIDFTMPAAQVAQQIIAIYLSDQHFENLDETCPLVALPSDTARGGAPVRQAYRQVLEAMIGLFQSSQGECVDARQRGIAIATLCIGGMVLARAVDDEQLGDEIRNTAMAQAFAMGGWDTSVPAAAAE
ncbi:MAG: TetR/AcrR family transcriptional regulator [Hyphomicrobiales bacterium]|nr:TetR/AcrR family transcriptional regulator [Hyphomicrobiales bacterium]